MKAGHRMAKAGHQAGHADPKRDIAILPVRSADNSWIADDESGTLLGCSVRHVHRLALKSGWRTKEETCRGGTRRLYHRQDVIAYAATKGKVVTPDPTPPAAIEEEPVEPTPLLALPDKARREVARRLVILSAWEQSRAAGQKDDVFVASWKSSHPEDSICVATLYVWKRAAKAGPEHLVSGYHKRESHGPRIPEPLRDEFLALYLDQAQPTITFCMDQVRGIALEKGLSMPSLSSWRRLVDEIPHGTKVYYRQSARAWHFSCAPMIRRDWTTVPSNQLWFADHHILDLVCKGPDGKPMRPWLTVFQDGRSRIWTGWYVGGDPNSDSLFRAAFAGIEKYGIPSEWYLDNGKDMRVLDLTGGYKLARVGVIDEIETQAVVINLNIKTTFALPHNPPAKLIERSFRICNERFSRRFESYCGNSPAAKPDRLMRDVMKHPEKWPTLDQVREAMGVWIEAELNRMPCEGSGADGERRIDVFLANLTRKRTASPADLALLMERAKVVRIRRGIIRVNGFDYWHEEFALRENEDVIARWQPDRPGAMHVYSMDGRVICTAEHKKLLEHGATGDDIRGIKSMEKSSKSAVKRAGEVRRREADEPDLVERYFKFEKKTAAAGTSPTEPASGLVVDPIELAADRKPAPEAPAGKPSKVVDLRAAMASLTRSGEDLTREAEERRRNADRAMALLGRTAAG